MFRNRLILLVLALSLAAASFGFTSGSAAGVIVGGIKGVNGDIPTCASGYQREKAFVMVHGRRIPAVKCVRIYDTGPGANNNTSFIQNNLAAVKVTPQLAAVLALFQQPAGSVTTNVSGLYTGTIPPYYEVTVASGNYVKTIYVDAWNGSFLPPQGGHLAPLPGYYFILFDR
ncbi:MAG: hypothetical protein P4L50_18055 [Anaerolineaceae bacterium]|nr:hypothetical protein [Anaerolineaceae bacterium]